jgi:uncharacterized protein YfaA (DUF2138 family)
MRVVSSRVSVIPVFVCLLASLACNDSTSASALGELSAQVVNANNAGVPSVKADLYKVIEGSAVLWRSGLTSSNGVAVFGAADGGVVAGDYYVHLSFVTNYRLADGETNDKAVTVTGGDENVVTFHVVAVAPGGP